MIVVHHKADHAVLALLDSLRDLSGFSELGLTIVDTGSDPECVSRIRAAINESPTVELLEVQNRGYFGSAKVAFDKYLAAGHALPDWVIVCNHDVVIRDKDFVEKLLSHDPFKLAVIAPRIQILKTGVDQNPFMKRKPGRLRWWGYRVAKSAYFVAVIWDWMGRLKRAVTSRRTGLSTPAPQESSRNCEPVYAAHGSFFIFSRRYFEMGGYLDGDLFLYGEEISVAEICRSLNLPIVYDPSLLVLHDEHQSTGKVISRTSFQRERDALRYVTARYLRESSALVASKSGLI